MSEPTTFPLIFCDRSRVVQDWSCRRKRWWGYQFAGRGVTSSNQAFPLFMGSCVHDSLAAIATHQRDRGDVDIDLIASTAQQTMFQTLMEQAGGDNDATIYAAEQAALVEGLLRGFHRHVWPQLMATYPTIISIEQEMTYPLNEQFVFMSRPDLILADQDGNWTYCVVPETKLLTKDLRWINAGGVKVGDKLIGVEEFTNRTDKNGQRRRQARQWNDGEVLRTQRLPRRCRRLTLSDGTSVACSTDHRWLVPTARGKATRGTLNADWISTSDLKVGTKMLKVLDVWNTDDWDGYDAGYVGGVLDGEGSLSQSDKSSAIALVIAQRPNQLLTKLRIILHKYGIKYSVSKAAGGTNKDVWHIYICGKAQTLKLMGITRAMRLIDKLDMLQLGGAYTIEPVRVVSIEELGIQEVVAIETSNHTYIAEGLISHNCEYKTTASKRDDWVNSWNTAVQIHSTIKAVEHTLGTAPASVIIAGLYKGYISYGKQNSPFCYAYYRQGTPPFSYPEWQYAYKSGFKRVPVWEMEGGVKAWVEGMPENVLADQFLTTPPIFIKPTLVEAFFKQTLLREIEIHEATKVIEDEDMPPDMRRQFLDAFFPQAFEQCSPAWGSGCQFKQLCHGGVDNPLTMGWIPRQAHHLPEMEQFNKEPNNA